MAFRPPYRNEDGSLATVNDLRESRPWLFSENSSKPNYKSRHHVKFSNIKIGYQFRLPETDYSIWTKVKDEFNKEFAVNMHGQVKYLDKYHLVVG